MLFESLTVPLAVVRVVEARESTTETETTEWLVTLVEV